MTGQDYSLFAAMMQRLPRDGRWTWAQRDRWLQALAGVVDLIVEMEEPPEGSPSRSATETAEAVSTVLQSGQSKARSEP